GPPINPDDACGLSVAVQATTIQRTDELPAKSKKCVADGKAPIHILSFEGHDQAANALLEGQADAAIADSMVTAYMIKASGGRLLPAGQMFDAARMGWAVAKGSPLAPALQQALERLIASGRYTEILDKWGVGVGAISNPQINARIN